MPHWMKHPNHGELPAYDLGEVERLKKLGWFHLNTGDAPDRTKKAPDVAEPVTETPTMDEMIGEKHEPTSGDILDQPVVNIIPQFAAMSLPDLEALRVRERDGKARKGLLKAMDEEIESRKD